MRMQELVANAAVETDPAGILIHEVLDRPILGLPSRHLVFFVVAALVVIVIVRLALVSYRSGVPRGLGAAVEGLVLFIRDEVAVKSMGEEGRRFTPLLLSFFFFILVAALVGLLPFAAVSTSNVSVTMGLAAISFAAQQWAGISRHGLAGHLRHLVPPGLPAWLVPIMLPVEILGMFTKPFALMVRLMANMLAGHMVIATLLLLIPLLAAVRPAFGWAMAPVSLALGVFIMVLEVLVAFIQAYIFTLLTAIFMGLYLRPDH
jgi:F-type H+-transporting ATPase subunit a